MAETGKETMNTPEIMLALKSKYPPPQYTLLFEVRNKTGYGISTTRYADAIVLDLYPSKGLYMSGFEFKTTRTDLINDLRNPSKHQEISKHCNFWWLVVGDRKIIKDGEIPEKWGLMVPRGKQLVIKKHAPLTETPDVPKYFMASLLRSALRVSPAEEEIRVAVDRAIQQERPTSKANIEYKVKSQRGEIDSLQRSITAFEEKSGMKIQTWNVGRMGEAVKFVMEGGLKGLETRIRTIKRDSDQISKIAQTVELWGRK